MVSACVTHIPLRTIPAQVIVVRDGRRLGPAPQKPTGSPPPTTTTPSGATTPPSGTTTPTPPPPAPFLQAGDQVIVRWGGRLAFSYAGNTFRVQPGSELRLLCSSVDVSLNRKARRTVVLAVDLLSGRVRVQSGARSRRPLVLTPEMLAYARAPRTTFIVRRDRRHRSTEAWTLNHLIVAAKASDQTLRINTRITYTAIS